MIGRDSTTASTRCTYTATTQTYIRQGQYDYSETTYTATTQTYIRQGQYDYSETTYTAAEL